MIEVLRQLVACLQNNSFFVARSNSFHLRHRSRILKILRKIVIVPVMSPCTNKKLHVRQIARKQSDRKCSVKYSTVEDRSIFYYLVINVNCPSSRRWIVQDRPKILVQKPNTVNLSLRCMVESESVSIVRVARNYTFRAFDRERVAPATRYRSPRCHRRSRFSSYSSPCFVHHR